MSTSGDVQCITAYHDECGEISPSTLGNTLSTLGDMMSISKGYYEYIFGCSIHH